LIDHRQVVVGSEHLQAHALVQADRQQVRHDAIAPAFPAAFAVIGIIDSTQVHQLLELAARCIAQQRSGPQIVGRRHLDGDFAELQVDAPGQRA
jgi:hypothetical protein